MTLALDSRSGKAEIDTELAKPDEFSDPICRMLELEIDYQRTGLLLVVGLLQASDVNLGHLQHGLHHARRLVGIWIGEHGHESARHDLS